MKGLLGLLSCPGILDVAELMERTEEALEAHEGNELERYRTMGVEYVKYAAQNPTRFLVMSDPEYADSSRSEVLRQIEEQSEQMIQAAVHTAQEEGSAAMLSPEMIRLTATALTYGLARMFADGHFLRAGVGPEQAEEIAQMLTEVLGQGIARGPG